MSERSRSRPACSIPHAESADHGPTMRPALYLPSLLPSFENVPMCVLFINILAA